MAAEARVGLVSDTHGVLRPEIFSVLDFWADHPSQAEMLLP